jgi:hypothetical protein
MHWSRLTISESKLTVIRSGCSVESKQSVDLVAAQCCVIQEDLVSYLESRTTVQSTPDSVDAPSDG